MNRSIEVLIAVGANMEPETNILRGMQLLDELLPVTGIATFYRTDPIDRPEQPQYLNGVVRVETALSARTLKFDVLRSIEEQLGRIREDDKFAPRPMDLDIILYGEDVIEESDLVVPDRAVYDRAFIAAGVLELLPGCVMPDTGKPLAELMPAELFQALRRDERFTQELRKRLSV